MNAGNSVQNFCPAVDLVCGVILVVKTLEWVSGCSPI